MSYRKEKKYRVTKAELYDLKNALLHAGMQPLYQERNVNSIYFDSIDQRMYYDSEEGLLPRRKVRIRWYDNDLKFTFERKFSSIEGRFKTTKKIEHISCIDDVLKHRPMDELYGVLLPTLKVSYGRTYFSIDGMRITFDANISYKNLRHKTDLAHKDPEHVIEVKVPLEVSDDFIEKVIPYPTARFSKYCRGLLISERQLSVG